MFLDPSRGLGSALICMKIQLVMGRREFEKLLHVQTHNFQATHFQGALQAALAGSGGLSSQCLA